MTALSSRLTHTSCSSASLPVYRHYFIEQLQPGKRPVGVGQQFIQQAELLGGQGLHLVPAADGATRGVSEILLVADLADTAFGALHPITGKNAAVRVCVEQGVIMVYTGENARTPTNCAVSVRKLFD